MIREFCWFHKYTTSKLSMSIWLRTFFLYSLLYSISLCIFTRTNLNLFKFFDLVNIWYNFFCNTVIVFLSASLIHSRSTKKNLFFFSFYFFLSIVSVFLCCKSLHTYTALSRNCTENCFAFHKYTQTQINEKSKWN